MYFYINNFLSPYFQFLIFYHIFFILSSPYILNIEWLEESMKLKRPASEELFLFEIKDGAFKKNIETPASPLSKKVYLMKCFIIIINL